MSRLLSSRIINCAASMICFAFLCTSFAGCGADVTNSNLQAGGGTGGTGLTTSSAVSIGTVSDAETMEVNKIQFNTQNAKVFIEGQYIGNGDEAVRFNVRHGYLSKVSGDIFDDTTGKAHIVEIFHMVKGPLESMSVSETKSFELQVMGQTVLGTTNTTLEGFDIDTLQMGTLLRVSGIVDGQGVIHAGHIVKVSDECQADSTVMVKGIVSNLNLDEKTFFINDLKVDFSEAEIKHLLHDGSSVWVNGPCGLNILKADRVREFSSLDVQGADQFALEGFFTRQVAPNQWQVGNYLVQISDSTILEGNALEEIAVGMRARVHGVLDNYAIQASKIVFYEKVEVQSYVTRIDRANRTLELAGVTDVVISADDNTNFFQARAQKIEQLESFGTAPYWVKIDRQGNEVKAYKRSDASLPWTSIGSTTFGGRVHNVYIGLCVTAGDDDRVLNTAVFDNVNVNPSADSTWQSLDIGPVERAGRTISDSRQFTIQASGKGISSRIDGFRYVYKPLNGDGSIEARVVQLSNTDAWAKAGIMIRESLAGDSPAVAVVVTPENGIAFQWRQSDIRKRTVFENLGIGNAVKIRGDFDNIDSVNATCIEFYDDEDHDEHADRDSDEYDDEHADGDSDEHDDEHADADSDEHDDEDEYADGDSDEHEDDTTTNGFYIYGPVKAPTLPFLTVLGTTFDTSGYQFYEVDSNCNMCLKHELSPQEFFNALSPNAMVKLYGTKQEGPPVYEGVLLFNNPDCWSYCGW
jgi:hypothetical protein